MKKQLLFILFSLMVISGIAQSLKLKSRSGVSEFYNVPNQKIQFTPAAAKTIFGLNANSDLVLAKTESDKLGFIHYRFYQTYKGVPVDKSMFVVHTKNGLLKSTTGNIVTEFGMPLQKNNTISADKAVDIAIAKVGAKQYAWQQKGMEKVLKQQTKNPKATYYPKAELVFYNPQQTIESRLLRLCYKVDVYAVKPLSRAEYFVDAKTGKILGKKDKIQHTDAVGTANTAWSGAQTIHSDQTGPGSYVLRDYTKGDGVITVHGEFAQAGDDYTSTSADWTLPGDNIAALDAHYGVAATYNYYWDKFGRNSYDDAGGALTSYVNEDGLDNAYWDGSSMHFFKLSNGDPGGVTGIDVTGHELTHGVTQETCGLIYAYESGAMNESLSDIMGKSVQFVAKPDDIDWRLSNDIGWIIRDMSNPNAEGQPDTYKGDLWYDGDGDNGGVHYNSGVGNFMFYLLVTGGSGTNDKGNNYSVVALGLEKADQIIYRTQSVYLTENSQYIDWRSAAISAATDLYGETSQEVTSVKNAFHAVGLGADSTGCDSPSGITASNVTKRTATISWSPAGPSVAFNLQYKLITANTWKTVSDITGTSYDLAKLLPGASYQVRIQTQCTESTNSGYSEPYTFTTENVGPTYCASKGSSQTFEYIERVGFNNKGYTSGNNGGYANLISTGVVLKAGSTNTVSLTPGFPGGTWTETWFVYVDYNKDGDFDDANEYVGTGSSDGVLELPIIVPYNTSNGLTRARVIMSFLSEENTSACGDYTYGETEDYSVFIKGGTPEVTAPETAPSIAVVPNPIKGNAATASINLAKQGNVNIKITDLSGSVLLSQNIANAKAGANTIPLNGLGKLKNGTFMIVAEQNGVIVGRAQLLISK